MTFKSGVLKSDYMGYLVHGTTEPKNGELLKRFVFGNRQRSCRKIEEDKISYVVHGLFARNLIKSFYCLTVRAVKYV